jgi:hypothetical protein
MHGRGQAGMRITAYSVDGTRRNMEAPLQLTEVPKEIVELILDHAGTEDYATRASLAATCKSLRAAVRPAEEVWKARAFAEKLVARDLAARRSGLRLLPLKAKEWKRHPLERIASEKRFARGGIVESFEFPDAASGCRITDSLGCFAQWFCDGYERGVSLRTDFQLNCCSIGLRMRIPHDRYNTTTVVDVRFIRRRQAAEGGVERWCWRVDASNFVYPMLPSLCDIQSADPASAGEREFVEDVHNALQEEMREIVWLHENVALRK